jgi:hypothetical protein
LQRRFFQLKGLMMALRFRPRYFAGNWSPVGCDEQNPVVDSRGKAQMQPVEQGCVLLQLPLHAAKPLLSVRNWRAETVPAHRTAVAKVASNVFLMNFLFMLSLVSNLQDRRSEPPAQLFCRLECRR